jgi:hypothetical protein
MPRQTRAQYRSGHSVGRSDPVPISRKIDDSRYPSSRASIVVSEHHSTERGTPSAFGVPRLRLSILRPGRSRPFWSYSDFKNVSS